MSLNKLEKAEIRIVGFCANCIERTYYPLFAKRYKNIVKQRNLRYAEKGKRAVLDLFYRENVDGNTAKKPLVFYIHGGGWVSGIKNIRQFYCYHWVDKGYVCANIDYDYSLAEKHPDHIRQIFKALEFVLSKADELNVDTSRVVIAGESAGGHFAALVGAVTTHPELYDELGIDFRFRDTFKPAACLLLSGIYDPVRALGTKFPLIGVYTRAYFGAGRKELRDGLPAKVADTAAPERYADSFFPPSFIIGSDKDRLMPESVSLYEKLQAAGVHSRYYLCKGINGLHAASLDSVHGKSGRECFVLAEKFLTEVLEKQSALNHALD